MKHNGAPRHYSPDIPIKVKQCFRDTGGQKLKVAEIPQHEVLVFTIA